MLMTAKPRPAVALKSAQLRVLASQLAEWSDSLRKAADVADSLPNGEIAVFNWLSVPKGLQLLESFVIKANESRRQALLGQPIAAGDLKSRSRAKATVEDDADDLKKLLTDRHIAAGGNAKKPKETKKKKA